MDTSRNATFWQHFPGLAWSNRAGSDTVMIRAALSHPRRDRLREIVAHFGMARVRAEWDFLRAAPITPLPSHHRAFGSKILEDIEADFQPAH